jgi:hypothetical protein
MSMMTPITGQPKIQITMMSSSNTTTGNSTGSTTFTPVYDNALACTATVCDIGSKGIVVAGGTLNSYV